MTHAGTNEGREPGPQLKIGGMALENGVLFQTDRHWAMALRSPDGEIEISSGEKTLSPGLRNLKRIPLLRGLAGLAENARVLPSAYARGGEISVLSRSPRVMASMAVSIVGTMIIRNPKKRLPPLAEEIAVSGLSLVPALVGMRKTRAVQYHAAEHKSINAYEQSGMVEADPIRQAEPEHPRCGTNIIGPAVVLMTLGNTVARKFMGRRSNAARLGVSILSLSGAVELIQWAAKHPHALWSKLLALPGEELQHFLTTSEPDESQLEVGMAALRELLRLEGALEDEAGEPAAIT